MEGRVLMARFAPGELIGSRYRLREPIGKRVWRGFDERLERPVGIRWIGSAEPLPDAAVTDHPNLIGIFDLGVHAGSRYLVTELPGGGTLAGRLQRGPVPAFEAGELACGVLGAVACLHRAGLRLGHLEPDDVLLGSDGRAQLDGFRLRRDRLGDGGSGSDLRRVGRLLAAIPVEGDPDPLWDYVVAGLKGRRIRTADDARRRLRCPPVESGQATEEFDALRVA